MERSKPYRNKKTEKPVGIVAYITASPPLLLVIGILQMLGSDPGFLNRHILIPEITWALFLAAIYLFNDLQCRRLIISSNKSLRAYLGYNVSGLNFLLAAIFNQ